MLEMRKNIINEINNGYREFIVFPYRNIGMKVHYLLRDMFNIEPIAIWDSELYKFNP